MENIKSRQGHTLARLKIKRLSTSFSTTFFFLRKVSRNET